ncbi:hypothetical protein LSH36_871g01017 [Paralvinella palmiformis]|uniref:Uncharacterized protein n=1 Tax=Paralvinella palmiformis TaxID=53620 RepID=A0AAD9IZ23_9ANNE|nr:hypothetical protein LSH36_871g01017 [Paralvinella palmiformis]
MYRSGLVQRPQPAATDSFVVRLVVCDEDVDAGGVPVAVAFGNTRTRRKREIVQVSAFRQHPCIPSLAGCDDFSDNVENNPADRNIKQAKDVPHSISIEVHSSKSEVTVAVDGTMNMEMRRSLFDRRCGIYQQNDEPPRGFGIITPDGVIGRRKGRSPAMTDIAPVHHSGDEWPVNVPSLAGSPQLEAEPNDDKYNNNSASSVDMMNCFLSHLAAV